MNKLPFYASLFVGLLLTPYQPWAIVLSLGALLGVFSMESKGESIKNLNASISSVSKRASDIETMLENRRSDEIGRHGAEVEISKALNSKLIAISDRLTSIENDRAVQASEAVRTGIGMR